MEIYVFIPTFNRQEILVQTVRIQKEHLSKMGYKPKFLISDSSETPISSEVFGLRSQELVYVHSYKTAVHGKPYAVLDTLENDIPLVYLGNDDLFCLDTDDYRRFKSEGKPVGCFSTLFLSRLNDSTLGIWQGHSQQILGSQIQDKYLRMKKLAPEGPVFFYAVYNSTYFRAVGKLFHELNSLILSIKPEFERILEDLWNLIQLYSCSIHLNKSWMLRGFHRYPNKNVSPDLRRLGVQTKLSNTIFMEMATKFPLVLSELITKVECFLKEMHGDKLITKSTILEWIKHHTEGYALARSRMWIVGKHYKFKNSTRSNSTFTFSIPNPEFPDFVEVWLPSEFFNRNWRPLLVDRYRCNESWLYDPLVRQLLVSSSPTYWLNSRQT